MRVGSFQVPCTARCLLPGGAARATALRHTRPRRAVRRPRPRRPRAVRQDPPAGPEGVLGEVGQGLDRAVGGEPVASPEDRGALHRRLDADELGWLSGGAHSRSRAGSPGRRRCPAAVRARASTPQKEVAVGPAASAGIVAEATRAARRRAPGSVDAEGASPDAPDAPDDGRRGDAPADPAGDAAEGPQAATRMTIRASPIVARTNPAAAERGIGNPPWPARRRDVARGCTLAGVVRANPGRSVESPAVAE